MNQMHPSRRFSGILSSYILMFALSLMAGCGGGDGDTQKAPAPVAETGPQETTQNKQETQKKPSAKPAEKPGEKKTAENAQKAQPPEMTLILDSPTKNEKKQLAGKAITEPVDLEESDDDEGEELEKMAPPKEGSPEWLVRQMILSRIQSYPEDLNPEQLRAARRERNLKIVKMAEEAIPPALKDPEKIETFNAAVNQLIESRLQLALTGNHEDMEALYDVADVLFKKDPQSKVAADAAFAVADFARTNAQHYAAGDPRWLKEFARQSRLFATNFPKQDSRAVQLLDAAGRSCEYHQMPEEAVKCYSMIHEKFPKSPQAQQAVAILRRLALIGKRIEKFGGPTLDGGHLKIEDYMGKVVLIMFWATDSPGIAEIITSLDEFSTRNPEDGFSVIGVCLDDNELAVDPFLEQFSIRWPQIIDPDPDKRRWNHPVVKYFGIRDIPMYWLLDRDGTLKEAFTSTDFKVLELKISSLLKPEKSPQISSPQATPKAERLGNNKSKSSAN